MNRRHFLQQAGATAALGLAGCTPRTRTLAANQAPALYPSLAPIFAREDRLFRITVCLRPFRATGPRLDTEQIASKLVVHNYGHGGSGWSLSWGSSTIAVQKALSNGDRDVAVIGCGALGLTSAILLQRAGARVTIYAKDRPPDVRSSRATGSWTPDSRIALEKDAPQAFPAQWEQMARTSWSMYQSYLGLPGNPVEYTDRYNLWDDEERGSTSEPNDPGFLYLSDRIRDLAHAAEILPPEANPFPSRHCSRVTRLQFNVADYSRQLVNDFLIAGGRIEPAEFHEPSNLAGLPQNAIINCTGYGARALFKDESIIPVRGQIGWLIPQPEVNYGFNYGTLNILARRDGIVVQSSEQGEATGWNDPNEQPDRREAESAVRTLAALYARMKPPSRPG